MNRRSHVMLLVLLAVGAGRAAAQAAEPGACRIQIAVHAGADVATVVKAVAATYGGRLESAADADGTVIMTIDDSMLHLIERDPRVRGVERAATSASARSSPQPGGTNRLVVAPVVAKARLQTNGTATPWTTGLYRYDAAGNITQIGADRFVYDVYSRLKSGGAAGQSQEYEYDRYGNITSVKTGTTTVPRTVDAATNRLTAVNGSSVSYDAAGQMLQTSTALYTYDGGGMMTSTLSSGQPASLYIYTPGDERIASVAVNGTVEVSSSWTFRDASGRVLRRLDRQQQSGQWTWVWRQDYIYNGDQMLASENDEPPTTRHYFTDHLGSPRLTTDSGGMLVGFAAYLPFGAQVQASGVSDMQKFTGHERDPSGLDYMHARYYSAGMGRFLSVDPVMDREKALKEPQRWNRYSYVINNPLRYRDPDGRQMKPTCTVDNCPPPAPIETVLRITPQNLERTAQANANKPPTITSTAGTPPTPGLVTVTGGVSVNFVALGGGNAGVGVMHANRVGTQHAALYAEGGVHTPSPRGSAGIQATIGIFRGGVTDQRGSFTNANFTIMQLGVTLAFTKAGGLVGVSGSWGPSVGAGYSTSESNTVLVTGDKVLEKIGVDQ
jgi:RHS repeat-associated protein